MPILVAPRSGDPLGQGDLLKDIVLHTTDLDGKAKSRTSRALVLSRRCAIEHAETVLVARVIDFKQPFYDELDKRAKSLDDARRMYQALRDGDSQPDRFYLGPILGSASLVVELDTVFTIAIPVGADDRSSWIAAHRIAQLDVAFVRDLHMRVFRSIATDGHDDYDWYADGDLDVVVSLGEKFLSAAKAKENEISSALAIAKAGGGDQNKVRGIEEEAKKQAELRSAIELELSKYKAVQEVRKPKPPGHTGAA